MKSDTPARRRRGTVKLSPQLERRRAIRKEKRHEFLVQVWRLFALVFCSTALGWLLLRHGWTLAGSRQIDVAGDTGISPELVAKVAKIRFPQPLLNLSPTELEDRIRRNLPVSAVSVERWAFPARLQVELIGQLPVAHATRQRNTRWEKGMVDDRGQWIQPNPDAPNRVPSSGITVEGWTLNSRDTIAELLSRRNAFGENLKTIVLHPDGAISLDTNHLGLINLGSDIDQLQDQIAAIDQLSKTMPKHLISKGKATIDLSNPARPELELPVKPAPKGQQAGIPDRMLRNRD